MYIVFLQSNITKVKLSAQRNLHVANETEHFSQQIRLFVGNMLGFQFWMMSERLKIEIFDGD